MITPTPWPVVALLGALGVTVGLLLNVLVYRTPSGDSFVRACLRCRACSERLRPRLLLPVVGWVAAGGRCECGETLDRRYPLVEAATGASFAALAIRFGTTAQLPAYLFLAAIGVAAAAADFDRRGLPDAMLLPAYVVSLLLLMPAGAAVGSWLPAARALAGMVALGSIYCALVVACPTGMGPDDIKLAGLVGLYLGWLAWAAVLAGAVGALLIAGLTCLTRRTRGRHGMPFSAYGACAVMAAGLAVFIAVPLDGWYGSLVAT